MWEYNDAYLAHYGKLGMKWGKSTKAVARVAYRSSQIRKGLQKTQVVQKKQLENKKFVEGNTAKLERSISKTNNQIAKWERINKKTLAELTPEQISRGKRSVLTTDILSVGLTGPVVGAAIIAGRQMYDINVANKYLSNK